MNRWFMTKLRWQIWKYDQKNKRLRRKYCHKGIHKLKMGKTVWNMNGKKSSVSYLTCAYCNYKFFATIQNKKKYHKLQEQFKGPVREVFSALYEPLHADKLKNSNFDGREHIRESSTRGD